MYYIKRIIAKRFNLFLFMSFFSQSEFIKLYDEFRDALYRYIFLRVFNKETALDLTSESFLRVWDRLGAPKKEAPKNIRAYLYKVSLSVISDHFKKANHEVSVDEEELSRAFESAVTDGEIILARFGAGESAYIYKVVASLPEQCAQVLILRYVEDLPYSDISFITGKSEAALRVAHIRAMAILRERLKGA